MTKRPNEAVIERRRAEYLVGQPAFHEDGDNISSLLVQYHS